MKLLFDQNLSDRLVTTLRDLYPGSVHVKAAGLDRAPDDAVWEHAQRNELIIVSKDVDFYTRSLLHGAPPKVIWIRRGNCSTTSIESILREKSIVVRRFSGDGQSAFLVLD